MKALILLAFLCCGLGGAGLRPALAQPAPSLAPADPLTTATAPGAGAASRARSAPPASGSGGIYARPGRCRELAIGRRLHGLARQRFIKRCRIARRAMPRPIPSSAPPAPGVPAPVTGAAPTIVPAPALEPAAPTKPHGRP